MTQLAGVSLLAASGDTVLKSGTVEGIGWADYDVLCAASALPHPAVEATMTQYRRMAFA